MSEHLSELQIEKYVSRMGGVDEILACAEHLDECFDCRDRAVALVDSGTGEISHVRRREVAPEKKPNAFLIVAPWVVVGAILVAIAWWLVSRV